MADIAHLRYEVDASSVVKATAALDGMTKSAERAQKSAGSRGTDQLAASSRRAASDLEAMRRTVDASTRDINALRAAANRLSGVFQHAFGGLVAFAAVGAVRDFITSIADANKSAQQILYTMNSVTGSMEAARSEFKFITDTSNKLGLNLEATASAYSRLAASAYGAGLSQNELHEGFKGLSEAFTALHRSGDEVNRFLIQLEQGMSLGKIQMIDLRAMSQSMPSVMESVSKAFERQGKSMQDMLKNGGIPAVEFFKVLSSYWHGEFAQAAEEASNSFNAMSEKLANTMFELKTSSGFMEAATEALRKLNDVLRSEDGRKAVADLVKVVTNGFTVIASAAGLVVKHLGEITFVLEAMAIGRGAKLLVGFGSKLLESASSMAVYSIETRKLDVALTGAGVAANGLANSGKALSLFGGWIGIAAAGIAAVVSEASSAIAEVKKMAEAYEDAATATDKVVVSLDAMNSKIASGASVSVVDASNAYNEAIQRRATLQDELRNKVAEYIAVEEGITRQWNDSTGALTVYRAAMDAVSGKSGELEKEIEGLGNQIDAMNRAIDRADFSKLFNPSAAAVMRDMADQAERMMAPLLRLQKGGPGESGSAIDRLSALMDKIGTDYKQKFDKNTNERTLQRLGDAVLSSPEFSALSQMDQSFIRDRLAGTNMMAAELDKQNNKIKSSNKDLSKEVEARDAALAKLFTPLERFDATDDDKALDHYVKSLRDVAAQGAAAIKAGASLSIVQQQVSEKVKQATAYYNAETASIAKNNAENKASIKQYNQMKEALDNYLQRGRDELEALEAAGVSRRDLNEMQRAEVDIRHILADATDENRKKLEDETAAIRENARERQQMRSAADVVEGITGGMGDFASAIENGANGWAAFGQAGLHTITSLTKPLSDLIAASKDSGVGSLFDALGKAAKANMPALGEAAGAIAMATIGGREGAVVAGMFSGAATGFSIGAAFSGVTFGLSALVGAAIGAIVGGVMGSMSDGDPAIYGSSRPGSLSRGNIAGAQTPFGVFGADTDNMPDGAFRQVETAVKGFDQQLARILDPSSFSAVQGALQNWSGKFGDIDALLQSRFDAALSALDANIQGFVNGFASDLEGRMQALADVLQIQRIFKSGQGIRGLTFDDAIGAVTSLANAGESALDAYKRIALATELFDAALSLAGQTMDGTRGEIVAFAASIAEAAGGIDNAQRLWETFFDGFYSEAERIAERARAADMTRDDALTGLGLSEDISHADFRAAFEAALPSLTPEQIATWLQAASAIEAATQAENAYIDALAKAQTDYASFIAGLNAEGAGLSTVSPFSATRLSIEKWEIDSIRKANELARAAGLQGAAEQDLTLIHNIAAHKVAEAIRALEDSTRDLVDVFYGRDTADAAANAASSVTSFGDAMVDTARAAQEAAQLMLGTLSPLNDQQKLQYAIDAYQRGLVNKEDVLQVGRRLYASSQAYTDLFNMLQNMPGGIRDGGGMTTGSGASVGTTNSAVDAAEQARRQHAAAEQIAQNIASLANAQGIGYDEVAAALDVKLSDLANELGMSNADFTAYLDNIVAQENAVPDSISQGTDRIIAALYDIADKEPSPTGGDWNVPTGGSPDFGAPGGGGGGDGNNMGLFQLRPVNGGGPITATVDDETAGALKQVAPLLQAMLDAIQRGDRDLTAAMHGVSQTLRDTDAENETRLGRRNLRMA